MKKILSSLLALTLSLSAFADEGMWLLPLLDQLNGRSLMEAGCKLTPEEIYSINHGSLKDAIIHFGGGCTGEIVSSQGLIATNHHCGYSHIQGLSTPEHNYLMNGYWAMSFEEEIPAPDLTVTFLISMEDVTDRLAGLDEEGMKAEGQKLVKAADAAHPHCRATLVPFYNDNVYYLIVYKTYKDIRFVGAPPASVGKFGGETDNWMWPRHTGDFSMFRVYAGPDNEPADYSPENKPYQAERFLKTSLKGVQEGDYTMILGYPGRTQRFQTAAELENMIATNRVRIDARTVRQDLMWEAMCADPDVQLKYANKYASSANGWKKWQGEELAFEKLDIIGREKAKEAELTKWINQDPKRQEKYGKAIEGIAAGIAATRENNLAVTLLTEAPFRIELVGLATQFFRTYNLARKASDEEEATLLSAEALVATDTYRDYDVTLDKKEAVALLTFYRERARREDGLKNLGKGFKDFWTMDIEKYVDYLFEKSVFTSGEKLLAAAKKGAIKEDPALALREAVINRAMELYFSIDQFDKDMEADTKAFGAALLEWQKGQAMYPDANSTMRLTYGHVLPYSPKDAVYYKHFTTLEGVMEKEDPTNPEFIVPAGLKTLFEKKDFGRYADAADGRVHTCFLTNNDITGGNSGSPVLDAEGNWIGLAFDGNWESMSSDVMFEPDLQRCICVDVRYVLFLVDKLGGAERLINELEFVD